MIEGRTRHGCLSPPHLHLRSEERGGALLRGEIDEHKKKMLAAFEARDDAEVLPDDLQRSINGFRESRTFLTAIELDAFLAVGSEADAPTVGQTLGTDPRVKRAESRKPLDYTPSKGPVAQVVRAHA